ncbi:methyltransferase domain-containing protein [Glaciimonas sp. GNP009]
MIATQPDLKEALKKRLFYAISAQIDLIDHVPGDIQKILTNFSFDSEIIGEAPVDEDFVRRSDSVEENSVDTNNLARLVNSHYDFAFYNTDGLTGMLFGDTEFRNIGYWNETTVTMNQASERLQDALLDFIPEKTGRILDVACGMGASTRRLLDHYPAENVWAINISEKQIESTLKNAPGCHAAVMNAVDMTFENDFFDSIECIEAAFHFETRRKFLEDSYRILKQDGRLVLSDILFTSAERLTQYTVFPSAKNHMETVEEYQALLTEVGFRNIIVQDVTKEVWGAHFMYVVKQIHEGFCAGNLNIVRLTEILWTYYHLNSITGLCLFVSAQK